jgi:hypothetical protein
MAHQFTVFNNVGTNQTATIDRSPDVCPWCHNGMEPHLLSGFAQLDEQVLYVTFYCTRMDCNRFFVGVYNLAPGSNNYFFDDTLLGKIQTNKFTEIIIKISSDFTDIYVQAEFAESAGLDEICGPGYRKALEFLIKDYIIVNEPSLKEIVEEKLLGACINDHIKDTNIKALSKRAVWIGNDETHYIRKWITKDINHLKKFIDLVIHWIETEVLTKEMIADMPESGPTKPPKL